MASTTRVADQLGVTYRQIDSWLANGIIPGFGGGRDVGSGMRRELTSDQVTFLEVMVPLVKLGIQPRKAAEIAAKLGETGAVTFGSRIMISLIT
jgi:hypothetical protein